MKAGAVRSGSIPSVVVTGSGAGLGAAYAAALCGHGFNVVVNDIDPAAVDRVVDSLDGAAGRAVGCVADVSDWDQAGRLVDTCVAEFGSIGGLVNNAGVEHLGWPWELEPEHFHRLVAVNLLGTMNCGVHAIRHMRAAGRGSIVNIVSGSALGLAQMSSYGASKGGIMALTLCWALDLQDCGVRVNAVSPQAPTGMTKQYAAYLGLDEQGRAELLARYPTAESNAPAVEYLLSEQASDISGQIVRTDGTAIGLIAPPSVLASTIVEVGPGVAGVAQAFDETLRGQLMPRGMLRLSGTPKFTATKTTGSHE